MKKGSDIKKKERIAMSITLILMLVVLIAWSFTLKERFSKKDNSIELIKENFSHKNTTVLPRGL